MTSSRKIVAWSAVLATAVILALFAMPSYRQGEDTIAGKKAEDFAMTLSGKPTRLSELKGKVVILNFFGSWCPPCIEETPELNKLQKRIESRNAVIVGVAADDDVAAYEKFLKDQNVIFPTYRDPATKDSHSPLAAAYGTTMYPETYIIDRKGKIARKIIGPQDWNSAEMLAYFDSILGSS